MIKTAAALALFCAPPAEAADCRLALLLGLDISSSVDPSEDALQRGGLRAALLSPTVQEAFFAIDMPVALAAFEWSGRYNQEVILDWTMVRNPDQLLGAADQIGLSKRSHAHFPTAIGNALEFGAQMMARGPDCLARTIDMAGDGENNEGPGPREIYAYGTFNGITVNALVITNAADFQTPHSLTQFFADEVVHGPGAFMVTANGFQDFERAMRLKLERELQVAVMSALVPAQ
ncbi:Von Willebrand factor type A domain protein [Sulfitobacter noctilucae]|uniref:DUF1194 domain-containing protein n=1 Tax=Sulfitobacter noctilucae TaxID=1342302 RepID=UPI0004686D7B|nr:DUF1194 domain-containing protein [Sulfitobacter noctilucae]KIN61663.1 Von Willebrand factor type A domain protein [Sulfitobacter noctilucae]